MEPMKDLLCLLGKKKEAIEIHREYEKRKIFGPYHKGLKDMARLCQGISKERLGDLSLYYCEKRLLKGIKDFVLELKEKEAIVGAISFDPQFLMEIAKMIIPFDFASGTEWEFERGMATGNVSKILDRYGEAEIIREKLKELRIPKENLIVIGNSSIVHLPSIKESSLFIGFDQAKDDFRWVIKAIKEKNILKI
jgi:phosphoserine phosphatase